MAQAMLIVPAAFLIGFVAVLFFQRPGHQVLRAPASDREGTEPEEMAALRPGRPDPQVG
jgi:hypothetical protein